MTAFGINFDTLTLGIYGALVSTLVLVWYVLSFSIKQRKKLKVYAKLESLSMETNERNGVFVSRGIGLDIVNICNHYLQIVEYPSLKLLLGVVAKKEISLINTETFYKFPVWIKPGEHKEYYLPLSMDAYIALRSTSGKGKFRIIVKDAERNTYKSSKIKLSKVSNWERNFIEKNEHPWPF